MAAKTHDVAYLWDMLDAARTVQSFVASKTLDEYLTDTMLQAAVERKIEIIGEAARKVSEEFRQAHRFVPWRRIIGLRNVLAHDYGEVGHLAMWKLIKVNIPELMTTLESLMPATQD